MDLVDLTYRTTKSFPSSERFGLTSQMRRAAVSIPSNIAEGHGRATRGEYCNLLSNARGSLKELETLFEIARRQQLLDEQTFHDLDQRSAEISKMLTALRRSLVA
jgi:four helix bundle protein